MDRDEIVEIFTDAGAIRHGHFQLTSGRHADTYIQCQRVMESPTTTYKLAQEAVKNLPKETLDQIDVVVSPAIGGITWGFAVALVLDVRCIFAERVEGKMTFRRSFEVEPGSKALVCEDVVTTGGSVKEVCDLIEDADAEVLAVISLIDRKTDRKFSQPFFPLLEFPTDSWEAADCELCRRGEPITQPGSRNIKR